VVMNGAGPTMCDGDPTTPARGTLLVGSLGPVSLASHTPSALPWPERCILGCTFRSKPQPKAMYIMFVLGSS
jgi:hypothetical protein